MMAISDGREGCSGTPRGIADPRQLALQEFRAADAKISVKLGDRRRFVSQRGDLSQHIEAVGLLIFIIHADEWRARPRAAVEPLGGDSETADVQALQGLANFFGRSSLGNQPFSFLLESRYKRRGAHPHLVSGPGLEQYGFLAVENLILKRLNDCPGSNRFLSKKISGPDQDADLDPSDGQRPGQACHQRRGPRIVNPAGKDEVDLIGVNPPLDRLGYHVGRLLPKHEAGPRADVPTALPPLEHESATAVAEVLVE